MNPKFLNWLAHTAVMALQAYIAYRAQSNPAWAWASGVIGMAQASMPSPFGRDEDKIEVPK